MLGNFCKNPSKHPGKANSQADFGVLLKQQRAGCGEFQRDAAHSLKADIQKEWSFYAK